MKKSILFSFLSIVILLSSCGYSGANVGYNYVSTEAHVQLSKKNFKVVDYVVGESSATYICLIGGLSKKALVEKAKSEMYKNANMVGNAKVILNQTVSFTSEHYPFVRILKCTVSGYVYEFTE